MTTNKVKRIANAEAKTFLQEPEDYNASNIRYPIGIGFIIMSKVFERFTFLCIQTVLVIYLMSELSYSNNEATVAYHASMGLQFIASLIGAIISDNYLGKFRTILVMSGVYSTGVLLLFCGSVPGSNLPSVVTLIALILLSIGVGCLKPCMVSFGGDQFKLPEQGAQLVTFFSVFYITLRVGALLSMTTAPILRNDYKCFGKDHCFPLVFGASAIFAILAISFFVAGNRWYTKTQSNKSALLKVFQCIIFSIRNKNRNPVTSHWLDKSIPEFGKDLVDETKVLLRLLILYIPVPFYWSAAEQLGSRFTIQATNMNGILPFYTIKPDQFQVVHPILVIMLIPIFELFIYPLLKRIGVSKPLHIMTIGVFLAAISFLIAGLLEYRLNESKAVLPRSGECQLRIFNPLPCNYLVNTNIPGHEKIAVNSMDLIKRDINLHNYENIDDRVEFISMNCWNITSNLGLTSNQAVSYLLQSNGTIRFEEIVKKSVNEKHLVRILSDNINQSSIAIVDTLSNQIAYEGIQDINTQIPLLPSKYEIMVNDVLITQIELLPGGVSTLLLAKSLNQIDRKHQWIVITPPNGIHILWQFPQYIILASADVMFAITGLSFTYAEAPPRLKTVMQAIWLFLLSIGHGIDIIVVGANMFRSQAIEFIAFSVLLLVDMAFFLWLSSWYHSSKSAAATGGDYSLK